MTRGVLAIFLVAISFLAGPASSESSADQTIRAFYDTLLSTMKDGPKLGFQGRVEKIRPAVLQAYDMLTMTKNAIGPAAAKLTPDELNHVSEAFTRYTVATYAEQFSTWDGERFEVAQPRPSSGGALIVPSRIVPKSGDGTEIDYLMRQEGGGQWKIDDVLLNGTVSQVAVRRSEFGSIFRREGLSGLIDVLDRKTAAMQPKQ